MKLSATIFGVAGAFATLLIGLAAFAPGDLNAARMANGALSDPGALKLAALFLSLTALYAGGAVASRPSIAGLWLFACSEAVVLAFGFNAMTFAPVLLMSVGGMLGFVVAQEDNAHRGHSLFGFSEPQIVVMMLLIQIVTIFPFVLYPVFLMKALCFALFACAFNLLIGYVGLMSFGHAAYFGMGSYAAGYAAKVWGFTPELAILLGFITGGALGTVFGWLAIRRQGIYFAMITLALAQMNYFFCLQAPFTGGEDGIQQIPRGNLFGLISLQSDMATYWMVAVIFLFFFLLMHRIIHSPFGQVLKAIRENEPRATSLGYRTDHYKLVAFILSAAIAGAAGGTKSIVFGIATLTDVHSAMSGEVVLMTLLGGLGTVFGPVLGAFVLTSMENYLAQAGAWVTVIQGVIFVACVVSFRRGIIGELGAWRRVSL